MVKELRGLLAECLIELAVMIYHPNDQRKKYLATWLVEEFGLVKP